MTKKGVKLIAPDKNGILCYQGDCKVIIDPIFKVLQIHPKNEDFFNISVLFEKKFIQKKNLLFILLGNYIFGEYNFQDFVLVFKNEELCKRVHDIIYKHKDEEEDYIQEDEFQQRLLIPIFQKLPQNYSSRFKRVIIDWIEKYENEEKMELLNLLKKQKRNQNMDIKNVKQEANIRNIRKRRFSEIENSKTASNEEENNDAINYNRSNNIKCENKDGHSKKNKVKYPDVIDNSKYKIVIHRNCIRRKLLVFTSSEKSKCYEYNFYPIKELFYHRCKKHGNEFKAILALDKNGNECIKYKKRKHICSPLMYDPVKYFETKIVKKPNYEILENCATQSKRMLIIFDPIDRSQCHEYYWSSNLKKFQCCGCATKNKQTLAEIVHENTDAEYILILKNEHVCELRKYDPKKYPESNNFVLSPNFEIQAKVKDGIERQTLIIFYGNDRKMCHRYRFRTSSTSFICNRCEKNKKIVSARIFKNDDGEEYVIISNAKHVCSPKEYIPQPKEIILRSPKIKFMESNETFKSKLFIFASNDNNMCYIFSKCFEKNTKRYYCLGCSNLTKTMKEVFTVFLCKEENGSIDGSEYYVKMMDGQKHICEPQKYEPEKYETKTLKPKDDYILFQRNDTKLCLAVYDPNDKSFCFKFYYYKSKNIFRCFACEKKNVCTTAKIQQDSDGNEYIIKNQRKHICKPIKISSIIKSDTVILEKSGVSFEKEIPEKKQEKEINESRIIRLPNFELQKNTKGVPERKLIVFCGDDKSLCYEYGYDKNLFYCYKCKISATLHLDPEKNNEKFIVLGPNEHTCEPVKYEAEKTKIVKAPNFMIFNQDDERKLTKLVIFISSTKEFCYEYSFFKHVKSFRCCDCKASRKIVSAKLLKDSNNEEYIQLLKNDHICEPKKFILEKFQPKIIPENGFKLYSNKNGKSNSKLILFDSEKNGFGFEYRLTKNQLFICINCSKKKTNATAKLCEKENGEKYLELSSTEHICKSTEYDPKMLLEKVMDVLL